MKPEGHLKKGQAFEVRANKWESESEAPSVIEDIFDAMVHYVAYGINIRYGKDLDTHASQKRFLRDQKEFEIITTFNQIEQIRITSVYGSGWNGEKIKEALELLKEIKKWSGINGK